MGLTTEQIRNQSLNAVRQWGKQWEEHAKRHSSYTQKPISDFENSGIGKAVLLIANGASFEKEIETIKKYQHLVDIVACDKTIGHCLDNGIIPAYTIVCDANVSYEKYLNKWHDQLQNTILFQNACGNPEWTEKGNWKDIYFFINQDILGSEKNWSEFSKCKNFIPAGTNVSNAMVVFMTQSGNEGRKNFFGYDKILLIGFDYSWSIEGNYYSFDAMGNGKHNYMRHIYARNLGGRDCVTSNNLAFSSQWLIKYIQTFKLPVVQCAKDSIFTGQYQGVLSEQMQYSFKKEDCEKIKSLIKEQEKASEQLKKIQGMIKEIGKEHLYSFLATT